jgi:hypothetical protein
MAPDGRARDQPGNGPRARRAGNKTVSTANFDK